MVAEWDGVPRPTYPKLTGARIALVMPTFKQCVDVHMKRLDELLSHEFAFLGGKLNHTRFRVDFPGGSWFQAFGAENFTGTLGIRADFLTVDECDDVPIPVYDGVLQPWLSEPWSLKMRLLGGTPHRGRHGLLYKMFRLGQEPNREPTHYSTHGTYRDVPETVDNEEVEKMRRTMAPDMFAREWECSFESGQGLVFPMFSESFHVRKPPAVTWDQILIGGDWGFVDPGAFVVIGVLGHGADTVCHILEEVYETQKPMSWWVDVVKRLHVKYPNARWYYEHKPEFIEEVRRATKDDPNGQVRMTPANKERGLGIQTVADALVVRDYGPEMGKLAQLYVSPECPNIIREFGLYAYRRSARDRESFLDDVDDSKNDHALDATRYALFSHFGGPDRRIFSGR